jgi:putative two-component system response regulator
MIAGIVAVGGYKSTDRTGTTGVAEKHKRGLGSVGAASYETGCFMDTSRTGTLAKRAKVLSAHLLHNVKRPGRRDDSGSGGMPTGHPTLDSQQQPDAKGGAGGLTPNLHDILVVDDEPDVAASISEVIALSGYMCTYAESPAEAIELLRKRRFDVVLADMLMPGIDGLELLEEARQACPGSCGILMSGRMTSAMARGAIRRGVYDVIAKPLDFDRVRVVLAEACEQASRTEPACPEAASGASALAAAGGLDVGRMGSIPQRVDLGYVLSLTASLEAKNSATRHHSENTAYYAWILGSRLGLAADELLILRTASLVHDVGKIGVPDAILEKPGPLTPAEYAVVKRHPRIGYEILRHVSGLHSVLGAVLYHHEWWDGSGYPQGLRGSEIPLAARVIHLADAIDAMFSRRSYRCRLTLPRVLEEIEASAGRQFDPRLARAAAEWLGSTPGAVLTCQNRGHLLVNAGLTGIAGGVGELWSGLALPSGQVQRG